MKEQGTAMMQVCNVSLPWDIRCRDICESIISCAVFPVLYTIGRWAYLREGEPFKATGRVLLLLVVLIGFFLSLSTRCTFWRYSKVRRRYAGPFGGWRGDADRQYNALVYRINLAVGQSF